LKTVTVKDSKLVNDPFSGKVKWEIVSGVK